MRFLTADYLFPLHIPPIKEGVLQISDTGKVVTIFESRSKVPKDKLEIFEGILCPGFVNAHCHLELSHLLGIAEKRKGFLNFLSTVQKRNSFTNDSIQIAIENAEKQMLNNGIVGVGDICNTADTLFQKQKGNMKYYNFIETFGLNEKKIDDIFSKALKLRYKFRASGQIASIVPHAPYSVPSNLITKINKAFDENDELLTIHMQETEEENQLFEYKKGDFFNWINNMNFATSIWKYRSKSIDILKEIGNKKMLLVHNTFAKQEDITDNYYCTCPKANLYIENDLPDYSIFDTDLLCVGTDSLASNNSLSILEELQIIKENSDFDMNTLLKIASKNGAEALGFSDLGTFETKKTPGVNLIKNFREIQKIY